VKEDVNDFMKEVQEDVSDDMKKAGGFPAL